MTSDARDGQLTFACVDELPRGTVRLLADALETARPGMRSICRLRALHLRWQVIAVRPEDRRIVVARRGTELVGLALAQRFSARAQITAVARLVHLVAWLAILNAAVLHVAGTLAVQALLAIGFANAIVGAVMVDGPKGLAGAKAARRRAEEIGTDHAWGRGMIAVAPSVRGVGVGRGVTERLLAVLPRGDHWVPVALTPEAERLYAGLGGTPIGGAASDVVARVPSCVVEHAPA